MTYYYITSDSIIRNNISQPVMFFFIFKAINQASAIEYKGAKARPLAPEVCVEVIWRQVGDALEGSARSEYAI